MLDRRQAVRQLLNVLWPNRCPGCDCFLTANEMVCPACAEDMLLDHDACCHVCGKVACRCKEARFAYDRAVVSFAYAGATIPAVYRLKDSQNNPGRTRQDLAALRGAGLRHVRADAPLPPPQARL